MRASTRHRSLPTGCLLTAIALGLAACGGGDDDPAAPVAPAPSVSGTVIDGPIKGATVCFDTNGNGACDEGEPTSGPTDETGKYTIEGYASEDLAAAPCIAMVPADAVDMDDPSSTVGTAFQMSAPAGKCGVVSPITTLVQQAVLDGLAPADAEKQVANQLMIGDLASLYMDYSADPSAPDSERLALLASDAIVPILKTGGSVSTEPPGNLPSGGSGRVARFAYGDPNNHYWQWFSSDNVVDDEGRTTFFDTRAQLVNGVARPITELYDTALALTESGDWLRCDETFPHKTTLGVPRISDYCGVLAYQLYRIEDVSGQSIPDVLRRIQAAPISTVTGVDPDSLPAAVFPDGSDIQIRFGGSDIATGIRYRESDGSLPNVTTIDEMISAHPVPAIASGGNTVSVGFTATKRYRAAFGPDGLAQYYLCEVQNNAPANCQPAGTGSYSVEIAHGTPVVSFTGNPAETDPAVDFNRIFVGRNDKVWYGYRLKPVTSLDLIRLNGTAAEALASLLGIVPPWQQQ